MEASAAAAGAVEAGSRASLDKGLMREEPLATLTTATLPNDKDGASASVRPVAGAGTAAETSAAAVATVALCTALATVAAQAECCLSDGPWITGVAALVIPLCT